MMTQLTQAYTSKVGLRFNCVEGEHISWLFLLCVANYFIEKNLEYTFNNYKNQVGEHKLNQMNILSLNQFLNAKQTQE